MNEIDSYLLDIGYLYAFIGITWSLARLRTRYLKKRMRFNKIDFKHPTNQGLLYFTFFAIAGVCVLVSIYCSDSYIYFY